MIFYTQCFVIVNAVSAGGIRADTGDLRLLEILERDFPALRRMLGQDAFQELGGAYIENHPAPYFPIRGFGRYFAGFLASHQDIGPVFEVDQNRM